VRRKQCVDSEQLFDFLRATVGEARPPPSKRARTGGGSGSSAARRKPGEAAASAAASAGSSSAPPEGLSLAADYRPLADADDDYDE
jgi:hypothetical protein